jgi:hypothetical protein
MATLAVFVHGFHRLFFIGAKSNAISISKHEPLIKANFLDDVLGHFRASGSELTACYAGSVAGLLTLHVDQSAGSSVSRSGVFRSREMAPCRRPIDATPSETDLQDEQKVA